MSRFLIIKIDDVLGFQPPKYQMSQAIPRATMPVDVVWERPILHGKVTLPGNLALHVLNLHLNSKLPTDIPGQRVGGAPFTPYKTAAPWAEGSFISSMKRASQALATRMLLDQLLDVGQSLIAVCGDFNATEDEVPLDAITGDIEDNNDPGLVGRVMIPCERNLGTPARFSNHHGVGQMIHVLVSLDLFAFFRHAAAHNEYVHDESSAFATDDKFPESDHEPVIAEFELP